MRASDYFFTFRDFIDLTKRLLSRSSARGYFGILILICAIFFLWLTSTLRFENIAILLFMIAMLYWRWDSKVPAMLALGCIISLALLLIGYQLDILPFADTAAEYIATWAYYFLILSLIKMTVEYFLGEKEITTTPVAQIKENFPPIKQAITKRVKKIRRIV